MSCKESCDTCDAATCPAVAAMRDTFDAIRQREVERHADEFDETDAEQLDRLTRRLMQRVVEVPRSRLPDGAACPGAFLERLFTPPGEM